MSSRNPRATRSTAPLLILAVMKRTRGELRTHPERELDVIERFGGEMELRKERAARPVVIVARGKEPTHEDGPRVAATQPIAVPPNSAAQRCHETGRKLREWQGRRGERNYRLTRRYVRVGPTRRTTTAALGSRPST